MFSPIKNNTIIKVISIIIIALGLFFGFFNKATEPTVLPEEPPKTNLAYLNSQKAWVNSTIANLSLDQKIGQLFMIPAYSNQSEASYKTIDNLIRTYHVGGIIFFQGEPLQQAKLTNRYQALSTTPLLIGIDGEWGLSMRLKNTPKFPKNLTLGAISDLNLVKEMGEELGRECKRMGIHINFAPVADINTNPKNPVINYRSFGESKLNVADKAMALAKGMQSQGVMACAKHFPGHGDTGSDSHYSLPVLKQTENELRTTEIYPFRQMVNDSISAVMTGHLYIPSMVSVENRPASVSPKIINGLLREELGFRGLALTDAMNMAGLAKHYKNGNAEVAAFKAGNDILLQSANIKVGFQKIKQGILDGTLSEADLDEKVTRILQAKYWSGLGNGAPQVQTENLIADLNNSYSKDLIDRLYQQAATIVRNQENLVPIVNLDTCSFVSLAMGPSSSSFQNALSKYTEFKNLKLNSIPVNSNQWSNLVARIPANSIVVVSLHGLSNSPSKNYGITNSSIDCIRAINRKAKVIVTVFGNAYALNSFNEFPTLISGNENTWGAHVGVAELLFGLFSSTSKLPITAQVEQNPDYGFPAYSPNLNRLTLGSPESVGMDYNTLEQIDAIAQEGIRMKAYPGCQVLVARKGKVVYNKNFGYLTYNKYQPVTDDTIYDLASVTKVASTLQAIMKLYESGQLDLNAKISDYLPELVGTNKQHMTVASILQHEAGLKSFQAFWAHTKAGSTFKPEYYSRSPRDGYLQVAHGLYIHPRIKQEVIKWIGETEYTSRRRDRYGGFRYLYSDLGLILMQEMVERITGQPLDVFVDENFYKPLGMTTTMYNPLTKFDQSRIAPTEFDNIFRKQQLQGTVHDPNAALLGGVAGHAGLFSNAWDLAKLFEMNLQKGYYGGRQFLFPETVPYFAQNHTSKSHRGMGWNKPYQGSALSSIATNASLNTYGHTGYTGTVVWVDPDRDLVFIMLCNRVYTKSSNRILMKIETRRKIHEVINRSIIS